MPRPNPDVYYGTFEYLDSSDPGTVFKLFKPWHSRYVAHSEVTPGWPRVARPLPIHQYRLYRNDLSDCFFTKKSTTSGELVSGSLYAYTNHIWTEYSVDFGLAASALAKAEQECRAKAKAAAGNWAQNLSTWKQTEDLTVNTIRRLTRFARSFRSGDVRGMGSAFAVKNRDLNNLKKMGGDLSRVPEAFLEVQYGWRPLLSDVYDSFNRSRNSMQHITHRVRGNGSFVGPNDLYEGGGPIGIVKIPGFYQQSSASVRSVIEFSVGNSQIDQAKAFGFTNPLYVIWDDIPFSFIVDWFYPVGQFLDDLDAYLGLSFSRGYYTVKIETRRTFTIVLERPEDSIEPKFLICKNQYFGREPYGSFPSVNPPHFKNPFSKYHVAEALSLLHQALFSPGKPIKGRPL